MELASTACSASLTAASFSATAASFSATASASRVSSRAMETAEARGCPSIISCCTLASSSIWYLHTKQTGLGDRTATSAIQAHAHAVRAHAHAHAHATCPCCTAHAALPMLHCPCCTAHAALHMLHCTCCTAHAPMQTPNLQADKAELCAMSQSPSLKTCWPARIEQNGVCQERLLLLHCEHLAEVLRFCERDLGRRPGTLLTYEGALQGLSWMRDKCDCFASISTFWGKQNCEGTP
jgi:hypothetical protein